jgi:AraC-like DNA-binding protein
MRFSTEGLSEPHQFEAWHDLIVERVGLGHVSRPGSGPFRAAIETVSIASLTLSDIRADPLTCEWTRGHATSRDRDELTVGLLLSGTGVVEQDDRVARIEPGDLVISDNRRPFRVHFDAPLHQVLFHCDRGQLEARLPDVEQRTARRVANRGALPTATVKYLFDIARSELPLGEAEGVLARHALDLVALTLGQRAEQASAPQGLRARVLAFIEANLVDPVLTPTLIAERHRISLRHLYRLFEEEGHTVASFIRQRRLEACRAALADDRQRSRSISEIAFAWGFNDVSHFGRAFREAFGTTPREYRRAALRKTP